jgi:basic amino acid/polyamine antiporter, APA family
VPEPGDNAPMLRRQLGLLDAVGIGFGAIIGAGIFVVTGVAAGLAGPALIAALGIAGVAAAANALSSAQLAARFPQAGGTYEYGYRLLGAWPGFIAGCAFLLSKVAAAGTVAIGLAGYMAHVAPGVPARVIAVGAVVVFTALNYFGIRRSSRANLLIVAISLGTLLLFVAFGMSTFDARELRPFAPAGWQGLLRASAVLFFAYTGYARIATLGEEVRDPERTIPRAVLITIGGAIALYVAVGVAAVGTAGAARLAASSAPLHTAAVATGSAWLPAVIALGAVTAMLGVILSQMLGLSRMAFAMARRHDLPEALGVVHARHGTPHRATLAVGAIAAVVALTGTLAGVAAAAAFAILIYYGITNVAALRLDRQSRLYPRAVPALGFLLCILLALSLPVPTILTGLGLLGAAVLVRLVVPRR